MPLLDFFWAMILFFFWAAWLWLVISIYMDIFRSNDLTGWAKAGWTIFVILVPFLGVFVYLIARGRDMQERELDRTRQRQSATDHYIRSVASGNGSTAEELTKLATLRDNGTITAQEFDAQKRKILA